MKHSAVEFRVLGPVGVWVDDAPVAIGGPGPRGLLAVLLLSRGKVVSAKRLVGALWGDEPPATMTGRVHSLVSEVRRSLSSAGLGPSVIQTGAGGYLLDPTVGTFDLDVFGSYAAAGWRTARRGERESAAVLFGEALQAWSGDALQGLERPFVEHEAYRLEQLRLDVVEAWAAALLEAPGVPEADLIHRLTALVDGHPQREASVALLMTALHRAGRRSEALQVYRTNRRWLRDELGLDPASGLRQLESAILHAGFVPDALPSVASDLGAGF
ncbi:DNA-binding SARP family transcriptional activator [Catenulispora sp. GAS73]|uniref:AfsR/SARP family transcriptional regulator n=1 Tax=Catenulispora sp. GAS73 TaxID=3156269 RepID=UPI00351644C7